MTILHLESDEMAQSADLDRGKSATLRQAASARKQGRGARRLATVGHEEDAAGGGGPPAPSAARRGRAALSNASGRFEAERRFREEDGWGAAKEEAPPPTHVTEERARTIITRNNSPDIAFDRSINPYRGCEHGCIYCFARPTHAYLGLSPGLDFETRLFAKPDAAELLERELSAPGLQAEDDRDRNQHRPLSADRTRAADHAARARRSVSGKPSGRHRHQIGAGSARPRSFSRRWPKRPRESGAFGHDARRRAGPQHGAAAATPNGGSRRSRRWPRRACRPRSWWRRSSRRSTMPRSRPFSTRARRSARARQAICMLRLPLELRDLFSEWLLAHYPGKLRHVLSLVRSARDGKLYDSNFGERMTGSGPYAWMIGRRFEAAAAKIGLGGRRLALRCDLFVPPARHGGQLQLL